MPSTNNNNNNSSNTTISNPYENVHQFMDHISFDVLNYILSFLPPIPHLFLLQRVNRNWQELCQLCMKEDVRVMNWTGVMTFDPNHVASEHERINRILFHHFHNIVRLELARMVINQDLLSMCASCIPQLQDLSFVQCSFQLTIRETMLPRAPLVKRSIHGGNDGDKNERIKNENSSGGVHVDLYDHSSGSAFSNSSYSSSSNSGEEMERIKWYDVVNKVLRKVDEDEDGGGTTHTHNNNNNNGDDNDTDMILAALTLGTAATAVTTTNATNTATTGGDIINGAALTTRRVYWRDIPALTHVDGRVPRAIDDPSLTTSVRFTKKCNWKKTLRKLTFKCCSFNQLMPIVRPTTTTTPYLIYRTVDVYLVVSSFVLALPNVREVDIRFVLRQADSITPQAQSLKHLFEYLALPRIKINYKSPRMAYVKEFTKQFQVPFDLESKEQEINRVVRFSNEFWRDMLCREFKFSKSRIDTLCQKYYNEKRMKDHEVRVEGLLKELKQTLNYDQIVSQYSPGRIDTSLQLQPTVSDENTVYDLSYFVDDLFEFLNTNPYYSIDADLVDEGGYNLIQQATNFNNFEVLLFLLRYFNEYRKERKMQSRKVLGPNVENEEWIDNQYRIMLGRKNHYGKTAVHSCFSGNRYNAPLYCLLRYGADVNGLNRSGRTIMHELASFGQVRTIQTITNHQHEIMQQLAQQEPDDTLLNEKSKTFVPDFNLQALETGETPLHTAIKNNMFHTFEEMLKYPVDVNLKDNNGTSISTYQKLLEERRKKEQEEKEKKLATGTTGNNSSTNTPQDETSTSRRCTIL